MQWKPSMNYRSFVGEFTSDWWIPLPKALWCWALTFHYYSVENHVKGTVKLLVMWGVMLPNWWYSIESLPMQQILLTHLPVKKKKQLHSNWCYPNKISQTIEQWQPNIGMKGFYFPLWITTSAAPAIMVKSLTATWAKKNTHSNGCSQIPIVLTRLPHHY